MAAPADLVVDQFNLIIAAGLGFNDIDCPAALIPRRDLPKEPVARKSAPDAAL
jgi:hypothetical protein